MDPTYLRGLFLKKDGTVNPVTGAPDGSADPVLRVMNDPVGQNYTFSVSLRSKLEETYVGARLIMEMANLSASPASVCDVQTLSWVHQSDGWVQLVVGMRNFSKPSNRRMEPLEIRGRQIEKGSTPLAYQPQEPKKAAKKKGRPAPRPSPLLAKLMRNSR
jgi:hypothetical protein